MFRMSCPSCGKELKSAAPIAPGKKVRCPGCQTVFAPAASKTKPTAKPADDEGEETPRKPAGIKKPAAPPPAARGGTGIQKKKPAGPPTPPPAPFGDPDDEEEMPPARKKAPPPPARGKSKVKPRDEEEDDDDVDDDEADERPRGKKAGKKKSALPMLLILAGAVVVLGGLFAVGAFVWPGFLTTDTGPIRPKGPGLPPPGPVAKVVEPLSYIPAEAFGVVGADLQGLRGNTLTAPLVKQVQQQMAGAGAPGEADKVFANVQTLHYGLWGNPEKGDGVVILQGTDVLDQGQVKEAFKLQEIPGKDFFQVTAGEGYLAQPDPKFVVLSPQKDAAAAEKVLGGGGPDMVMPAELRELVQQNKDALVYFAGTNEPAAKEQIRKMRAMAGPKSPLPDRFWTILENAKAGTLTLRPDGDGLKIQVGVTCVQDAEAPELSKMVDGAWNTAVKPLLAILPIMLAQKKGAPSLNATIQDISNTFKVEAVGAQAVASIRFSPAAMAELSKGLPALGPGPK